MSGAFFFMNLQHFLEMLHHLPSYIDRFNNLRLLTQTNHPRKKLRANCYWLRNSKVVCTILSQWGFVSKSIQNNANEIIVEAHFNRYQFTLAIHRESVFRIVFDIHFCIQCAYIITPSMWLNLCHSIHAEMAFLIIFIKSKQIVVIIGINQRIWLYIVVLAASAIP